MSRFQSLPSRAAAIAAERTLWNAYYARECARRGLVPGVDSLDKRGDRVLPLAEAVTTNVGHVRTLPGGVHVLEVPGDELDDLPEAASLVARASLPQAVLDALDADDATRGPPPGVGPG